MSSSPLSYGPRSKNACEPCRRKKTKCPGEQPTCSFCARLDQRCTYTNPVKAGRVRKTHCDSPSQISRLQAQVDQMNSAIQALTRQSTHEPNAVSREAHHGAALQTDGPYGEADVSRNNNSRLQLSQSACAYPPPEVMSQLIEIYRHKIHLQPFPLFDPARLFVQWTQWPHYMLQSFLATSLAFADPLFLSKTTYDTRNLLRLARAAVIPAVTEGAISLPLLQSLCLLTMCDLAAKDEARVSIDISIVVNLARRMDRASRNNSRKSSSLSESETRCYWTVFILERTFTRGPWLLQLDTLTDTNSAAVKGPPNPLPIKKSELPCATSATESDGTSSNSEILPSTLQLFSLWGRIVEYATGVQFGRSEKAWLATSIYFDLGAEFYKFETSLAQIHRFKNIGLTSRSPEEISRYKEYWSSWLSLQITFHTGHALLNHPLIHILGHDRSVTESSTIRPPSFLQQTIDQGILHAGWTTRLIRTARDMGIVINDPVIGHQVLISATVHWLFSFASDSHIAERALSDFDESLRFLRDIASRWPQFSEKAAALDQLQTATKQTYGVLGQRGLPASISTILWDLIDPCQMSTDTTVLATVHESGGQIPTEHLVQLHERSKSGSQQHGDGTNITESSLACLSLMQYPGLVMDENLVYPPDSLSGSLLDCQFSGEFGSLGGL